MSFRLEALSLYLRLVQKPFLARAKKPVVVRAGFERTASRFFKTPADTNIIEGRIEGPAGPIPVDWLSRGRPDRRAVVIYFHGGAYIMGSRATHRALCAHLAGAAGARVITPEYRLAPEHPFPAAVDDALAVYRELLTTGYDPARIAFAGDSAGGGLAFATFLAGRDAGLPDPACIVGFSPWLDMTMTQPSLKRNARRDPLLPAARFAEVAQYYLNGAEPTQPLVSPLLGDFRSPPPALIQASRIEILADEAEAMATKWREAGGDIRLEWWRRTPHAWQIFVGLTREADDAVSRAGAFIAAKLAVAEPDDEDAPTDAA